MLDCLIVGDSIAVGTHQFKTECRAVAKGGINSWQWNKQNSNQSLGAKVVVISLGSNDHPGVRTLWELQELRRRVYADRVYWIMPAIKPDIQQMIKLIADDYGDTILPIARLQADKVHPSWAGYKDLADQIK
jgi:lysophospholipase L1-like esterase